MVVLEITWAETFGRPSRDRDNKATLLFTGPLSKEVSSTYGSHMPHRLVRELLLQPYQNSTVRTSVLTMYPTKWYYWFKFYAKDRVDSSVIITARTSGRATLFRGSIR